jgi:hypothetical protein
MLYTTNMNRAGSSNVGKLILKESILQNTRFNKRIILKLFLKNCFSETQDMNQFRAVVKNVMNILVPRNVGKFLSERKRTIEITLFHVITDVSEQLSYSIIRVTKIGELETLVVTSKLLVTANVVPM